MYLYLCLYWYLFYICLVHLQATCIHSLLKTPKPFILYLHLCLYLHFLCVDICICFVFVWRTCDLHPVCIEDAKTFRYVFVFVFFVFVFVLHLFVAPATCIQCVFKTPKQFFLHNLLPDVDFPVPGKDPLKDLAQGVHFQTRSCSILAFFGTKSVVILQYLPSWYCLCSCW